MLDLAALKPQVEALAWYTAAKHRLIVVNLNATPVAESVLSLMLDQPVAIAHFPIELDPALPPRPQVAQRLRQVAAQLRDLSANYIVLPADPLAAFIVGQAVGATNQTVGLFYLKPDGSLALSDYR